ncbi:sialoadhesin-like isoform X1 [Paramisgurnus dabryanus]|uniref:sialoadhesin-like isoform X1 n=1 Tax=Paramisgurnus dabryanus TaxID=90735 RepID=UPI0031F40350
MEMCFRISLMFLLMIADVDGQQDWEVNYSPSYVCALRGSTVRITCTLKYPSDHVIDKTFWTKVAYVPDEEPPDLCLDPENRRRVQCQSKDQDTHSITLTDVTEADKRIYYCRFITDKVGRKWSGVPGVQLDVTDLQVETNQTVKVGDSVTLTCKTTCSLPEETTFIWYRNKQRFTKGITTLNQLHLRSVSRDDSGDYRCAAVKGYERLLFSPDVYLRVDLISQQDWEVNYSLSYVCALRGSTVRITCTLKYPSDHVVNKAFWTKVAYVPGAEPPDLCLDPENRRRVQCQSKDQDTHSIALTDVTEADKHIYYCRFITDRVAGKYSGVPGVQLDVTDLQVETKQRVKVGDSVTLTCKTTCSLTEETTFIWYRNKQRFTKGIKTLNQLHLRSVSRDDSGVYRCAAAVRGSERLLSSPDVYLNVELISQQDLEVNYSLSYVCALRGSTVRITCTLKYPSDHVVDKAFWTKVAYVPGGEPPDLCLDPENRRGVQCYSENNDTHSITLTDVTEADKHIYYCRFITDRVDGKWSGVPGVQLDVTDLQVETKQRVQEGDSVTFTCKTTCSLPEETTFIWYRNKQRFTKGIKTLNQLHLRSVSRDDSGDYRCDAVRGSEHVLSSPDVFLWVDLISQKGWGVNYSPSYVCALRGSTVRITCTLKYPSHHVVNKASWTKVAYIPGAEPPDLCLDPDNRRGVQCQSKDQDTHSITLTDVTEADKRIYYCRFITDRVAGKWSGIPGIQLDVTDLQVETNQRVKEGDSVTLTCKTTCILTEETTFIWYRNKQRFTKGITTLNQLHLRSVSRDDSGDYRCAVRGSEQLLSSPGVYLIVEWVQGSALYYGIVAGCLVLFFIIVIFIILFIWKKRRDRQNQANGSSYVPLFTLASTNQSEASKSADVE